MRISDWSSDVCSSDLTKALQGRGPQSQFGSSLPTKKPQGNSHRRRSTAHRSASFSRQFARSRRARKFSQTPNLRYVRGQQNQARSFVLSERLRPHRFPVRRGRCRVSNSPPPTTEALLPTQLRTPLPPPISPGDSPVPLHGIPLNLHAPPST